MDSSDLVIVLLLLRADGLPSLSNGGGCVCVSVFMFLCVSAPLCGCVGVTSVCICCVNNCMFYVYTFSLCVCVCVVSSCHCKNESPLLQNHLFNYWILIIFQNGWKKALRIVSRELLRACFQHESIESCFLDTNGPICHFLPRHSVVVNFWNEGNCIRKMGYYITPLTDVFLVLKTKKSLKCWKWE